MTREVLIDDAIVTLQIWDTAGQERFRLLSQSYYRGATGVLIVYDVTNRESFAHVDSWVQEAQERIPLDGSVPFILIGNKCDLEKERQVPTKKDKSSLQHTMSHSLKHQV